MKTTQFSGNEFLAPKNNDVSLMTELNNAKPIEPVRCLDEVDDAKTIGFPAMEFGVVDGETATLIINEFCGGEAVVSEGAPKEILRHVVDNLDELKMAGRDISSKMAAAIDAHPETPKELLDASLLTQAQLCKDIGIQFEVSDDVRAKLLSLIEATDGSAVAVHAIMVERIETPLVEMITSQALERGDLVSFDTDANENFKPMTMLFDPSLVTPVRPGERIGLTMAESRALAEKVRLPAPNG